MAFSLSIVYLKLGGSHGAPVARPAIEAARRPPLPVITPDFAPAIAAPALPGGADATAGALVKCVESGKVTYSNVGCANDRHPLVVDVQATAGIASPSAEVVRATLRRMRADAADNTGHSAATSAPVRRDAFSEQDVAMQCRYLVDRNNEIDRWARQPHNVYEQERLKAEKLDNIGRLRRLSC